MKPDLINFYVDETGKSGSSPSFIVCLLCLEVSQPYEEWLLDLEQNSGKKHRKWRKSSHPARMEYVQTILESKDFVGKIFFIRNNPQQNYDTATIQSICKVILTCAPKTRPKIFVDALSASKVTEYSNSLKRQGVRFKKIRGVKKEDSSALMRLPDAIAGFLMDALFNSDKDMQAIYAKAIRRGTLVELV